MASSSFSCTADGTNTNIDTCKQGGMESASLSLPPLPSIIRHDEDAYFEQRLNLPPLEPSLVQQISSSQSVDDSVDAGSNSNDNSTKNLPKKWLNGSEASGSIHQPQCRLYMAESSIPNSGLGMYAGIDIPPATYIDTDPQIVIPLIDIEGHASSQIFSSSYSDSILNNYPWNSYSQGAHLESKEASVLYPNLGMLANSHMGLAQASQTGATGAWSTVYSRELDLSVNPGMGSTSGYGALSFQTKHDVHIKAGEEILVDYGSNYFHHREDGWNTLFPTKEDYDLADRMVGEFLDGEVDGEWEEILTLLNLGKYDLPEEEEEENEKKEETLKEKRKRQRRIAHALPKSTDHLELVSDIGTAKYSLPNSTVSMEHLATHGICLDNLRRGKSSIPQAGYGAFATKNLDAESIIAPAPLLPIKRDLLYMQYAADEQDNNSADIDEETIVPLEQLLLNYCFGHPQSSLLFFPYSSSVHYINHNSINPNAYIRWSDSELNRKEMLEKEVDNVYTGIILEFVALRDIEIGEEITIDYGPDWTMAWHEHVQSWDIDVGDGVVSTQNFIDATMNDDEHKNDPIRTMKEQEENPYPECVRTACFSKETSGDWKFATFEGEHKRFCDVIDRTYNRGNYWYTVKMHESEFDDGDFDPEDNEIKLIPNQAVFFVPDEYCSDIHLDNAFRQEIGVPEGLYPDIWLDLKDQEVNTMDV